MGRGQRAEGGNWGTHCSDQGEHDLVLLGAKRMLLCGEGGWDGYVCVLRTRIMHCSCCQIQLAGHTPYIHLYVDMLCFCWQKKKCIYSRSQESFLSLSIFLCCFIFGFGFVYLLMVWEMDIHSCPLKVISKEKKALFPQILTNNYKT